jgi:hypothetical protein
MLKQFWQTVDQENEPDEFMDKVAEIVDSID